MEDGRLGRSSSSSKLDLIRVEKIVQLTGPALLVEVLAADQVEVVLVIVTARKVVVVFNRDRLRSRPATVLEHFGEWRVGLVISGFGGLVSVELTKVIEGVNEDFGALHGLDRRTNQQD